MPKTYKCPICGHLLPALSEHMLICPEGDSSRRRHAHTACVLAARRRGQLLLQEDWRRRQAAEAGVPPRRFADAVRSLLSLRARRRARAPRE